MSTLSALLGGMGLFLVGMWLLTDGLKLAAGDALHHLLQTWTNSRTRGLATGFFITALVQSSSAVTVATIGFSNAGLLSLEQAVWVIFGSNVGTTMTGWIVAIVGFKINIDAFALPLIGIGMVVRLTGIKNRRAAIGQSIVGFGLLFLGIDLLKDTFETFGADFQLPEVTETNITALLSYVFLGFLLTTIMQSSSAAIVITLTAAEGGLVTLPAAAAAVIGANLGTTTTAILSVWGATSTAKRVATSHVLFNLLTAIIAVIIITPVLGTAQYIQNAMNLSEAPATTLAIFHTLFNILGVILMWHVAIKLVDFLSRRFVTEEEISGKPKYLDTTVLEVPTLAVAALFKELARINQITIEAVKDALSKEHGPLSDLEIDYKSSVKLASEIGGYTVQLNRFNLPEDLATRLPRILESAQKHTIIIGYACEVVELQRKIGVLDAEKVNNLLAQLKIEAVQIISAVKISEDKIDLENLRQKLETLESTYQSLKHAILVAGAKGEISMIIMDEQLQQAFLIRRISKQIVKAVSNLPEILIVSDIEDHTEVSKEEQRHLK